MATNKELYDESSRKTYNNIDSNEQLMYVEVKKNTFAGYRRELLVYSLSELETDFYVCTECKGVMRNACLTGEEHTLFCEVCVKEGVPSQSMVKSRNKILELQAKCPLATRGCNWNGKMVEVEEHLIVCDKVVVKCNNACDVILPRCELDLHLTLSCVKRRVTCEHCNEYFMYEEITNHYLKCLEYQVPCPNNCSVNLKRKLLNSHLEYECPNTVVNCPYKNYGCRQEVLRCTLVEHMKINQIQHLEYASIFALREMGQLKQTNIQQTEMHKQQTETNKRLTETNKQLTERVTTLENLVEKLSYSTILRDKFILPKLRNLSASSITILYIKVNWKFLKIGVVFKCSNRFILALVRMENDDKVPLEKWPFEGRFKLTVIDSMNIPRVYESDFIKLQPENVSKDKGQYPSEQLLAKMTLGDKEGKFITDKSYKYTFQIQSIENQ